MTPIAYRHLACSAAISLFVAFSAAVAPATQPATGPASQPASSRAVAPLPVAWLGHFRGTTVLRQSGKASRDILMDLTVEPIPGSASVTWRVQFDDAGVKRDLSYQLDPIPGHRDRFLMDDHNLGLTDQSLVGNALIAQFNVPGNIVYSRFQKTDEGVEVEISNFVVVPRKSGLPGAAIQSYPLLSAQTGLLKPVAP